MNDAYGVRALQQEVIHLKDENRALREEILQLRHAIRALNLLDQSLDRIGPETDVYGLLNGILSAAIQAVDAEGGSLLLLDEEAQELVFVETIGERREQLIGYRMSAEEGIVGASVRSRKPLLVPDVRREPQWFSRVDREVGFETVSVMCVPMVDGARALGAIELVNKRNGVPFTQEDLDVLLLVGRLASLALIKAESMEAGKNG